MKTIFGNIGRNNKDLFLVGNFNINVLDYEKNAKVKSFVNIAFQNSIIPVNNKPTRVTRTNSTVINHILTNAFLNKQIKMEIIKTEISSEIKNNRTLIYKKAINAATKENFKNIFARKTLDFFKEIDNLNESYSKLLYGFSLLYEESFPKLEIKIKQKNLISPWINKGIKQKQKVYKNFLNRENNKIK